MVMKITDRLTTFVVTGGEISHIAAGKVDFLGVVISAVPFSKFPRSLGKSLE
jgi:uncharacterized protein YgbK (DUF1537 family)